jgi:hypothetical protein
MAKTGLKILESNKTIEKEIKKALSRDINVALLKSTNKIKTNLIAPIKSALLSSPEIMSLQNGLLAAEFGLTYNPAFDIVNAVLDTLEVEVQKVDANLVGGITITMQPSDFANLLTSSFAEQKIDGGSIPWLRWLLTAGDTILIADFGVEFGSYGRSGGGRMRKKFAPYKVNSAFSGTPTDNFITRAIERAGSQITEILKKGL